jgi:heme exporter protein D
MPITNWSTVGGDLRVPHFVGLHAIQVFVLAVLVLGALAARVAWLRSERVRAQLTGVLVLGYTGLFVITAWQAVRGQSLVHPDAATWTAFGVTVAVTASLAAVTVAAARRGPQRRGRHALSTRRGREPALRAR